MSDGSSNAVTPEAWEQALAAEFAAFLEETQAAMNAAREGHWIADTEEVVRDAGARLRQRALEKLLQLRVQAGEGAFSPPDRRSGWQDKGPQAVEVAAATRRWAPCGFVGACRGSRAPGPKRRGMNGSMAAGRGFAWGPGGGGRELRRTSRRLGLERTDEVLTIVDGAPWIRAPLQRWRSGDRIGLDFYHFTEHVAAAAKACFGDGSAAAAAWREQVLHAALHTGPDDVLDEITRQRQQTRAPAKREALRRLRAYVGERVTLMDYPACRAKGWDLGSGPTEAQCKTMTARLKGSGRRWDPANAEAMLVLNGVADSDEWSAYWHGQGAQWN